MKMDLNRLYLLSDMSKINISVIVWTKKQQRLRNKQMNSPALAFFNWPLIRWIELFDKTGVGQNWYTISNFKSPSGTKYRECGIFIAIINPFHLIYIQSLTGSKLIKKKQKQKQNKKKKTWRCSPDDVLAIGWYEAQQSLQSKWWRTKRLKGWPQPQSFWHWERWPSWHCLECVGSVEVQLKLFLWL